MRFSVKTFTSGLCNTNILVLNRFGTKARAGKKIVLLQSVARLTRVSDSPPSPNWPEVRLHVRPGRVEPTFP